MMDEARNAEIEFQLARTHLCLQHHEHHHRKSLQNNLSVKAEKDLLFPISNVGAQMVAGDQKLSSFLLHSRARGSSA